MSLGGGWGLPLLLLLPAQNPGQVTARRLTASGVVGQEQGTNREQPRLCQPGGLAPPRLNYSPQGSEIWGPGPREEGRPKLEGQQGATVFCF